MYLQKKHAYQTINVPPRKIKIITDSLIKEASTIWTTDGLLITDNNGKKNTIVFLSKEIIKWKKSMVFLKGPCISVFVRTFCIAKCFSLLSFVYLFSFAALKLSWLFGNWRGKNVETETRNYFRKLMFLLEMILLWFLFKRFKRWMNRVVLPAKVICHRLIF